MSVPCLHPVLFHFTGQIMSLCCPLERVLMSTRKGNPLDLFIPLINVGSARHVSTFATTADLSRAKPRSTICATMVRSLLCQGTSSSCYPDHKGPVSGVQEMLTHAHLLTGTHFCWMRGNLIPWTNAFNFSLKLQSNKLPAHIFPCQMFPLWWIWRTLGPTFEPLPLPGSPQTLLFSFKLISSFSPRSGYI